MSTDLGSQSRSFQSRHVVVVVVRSDVDVDRFECQRMSLHLDGREQGLDGDVSVLLLRFRRVDGEGRVFILVCPDGCPGSGRLPVGRCVSRERLEG